MNQLRTTPATTRAPAEIRKAKEPAEQAADQFAAMFASFWVAPLPQPESTPEAKSSEAVLASGTVTETPGANSIPVASIPVIGLQTPALETGDEVPEAPKTLIEGVPLTGQPATWISPEQTLRGLSLAASQTATTPNAQPATGMPDVPASQPQGTALSMASTMVAETMKPALETTAKEPPFPLEPRATLESSEPTSSAPSVGASQAEITGPTADSERAPIWQLHVPNSTPNEDLEAAATVPQIPSSQPQDGPAPAAAASVAEPSPTTSPVILVTPIAAAIEPTAKRKSRLVAEAPVIETQPLVANNNPVEQTLQTEAARRDANLMAGYLAETTRNVREAKPSSGLKTLANTGFDLAGENVGRDSDFDPRLQVSPLAGKVSFAATVRDLQSGGNASSIQSQAINQIIAQAELLQGNQTRSLRLRLRPEELGQIDIQISRDAAGRISGHIFAERESARGTLSRSLDELRETLSRAGLTVDKLQISAHPGLFNGNRETDDTRSNTRESSSTVAKLLTENETGSDGQLSAETERLLSLRA